MKEIKAYIKPHKLSDVTRALHHIEGLTGMSIIDVKGFGRPTSEDHRHRIKEDLVDYVPHAKIEIVCHDELASAVVDTIRTAAHTGLRGDGKIYVSNVEHAVRISTGESGDVAA